MASFDSSSMRPRKFRAERALVRARSLDGRATRSAELADDGFIGVEHGRLRGEEESDGAHRFALRDERKAGHGIEPVFARKLLPTKADPRAVADHVGPRHRPDRKSVV